MSMPDMYVDQGRIQTICYNPGQQSDLHMA
jgi:hypothetical protein